MIEALKRHLVLLYTCVTGAILTGVILIAAVFMSQSSRNKADGLFNIQLITLYQKLQYDDSISHSWLNDIENGNDLIISISQNGQPLLYPGAYRAKTSRDMLFSRAEEEAWKENISINSPPLTTSFHQSSMFSIKGDHGDTYRGSVLVFLSRESYYSIMLLKDTSQGWTALIMQYGIFFLVDLLGILCLFLANKRLVLRSLQPILENEKKQQAFLAAASHELRSPLSVIQTSAETALVQELPEDALVSRGDISQKDAFLQTILRECKRMSRLVTDMLLLTSSQNVDWQMQKSCLDMDTLMLNLYETYENVFQSKGLTLKLQLPENALPRVMGDEQRMTQIFSVLLDNACAHAGTDRPVCLKGEAVKNKLLLSVSDHGKGIKKEEQEHIFDAFYRADTSRKDKQHFGLGLSVAAQLAKRQGGRLYLKDTPGGGCTFYAEFPVIGDQSSP